MDSYNIFNTEKVSVSVIIPCYQCTSTIQRAVDSVAQQSLLPREVILVDDASDDETLEMLYSIQKSYGSNWVKVLSLKTNGGPSLARNAAWELVDSSYVAFLDADDSWHPQKIEIQFSWTTCSDRTCRCPVAGTDRLRIPYRCGRSSYCG